MFPATVAQPAVGRQPGRHRALHVRRWNATADGISSETLSAARCSYQSRASSLPFLLGAALAFILYADGRFFADRVDLADHDLPRCRHVRDGVSRAGAHHSRARHRDGAGALAPMCTRGDWPVLASHDIIAWGCCSAGCARPALDIATSNAASGFINLRYARVRRICRLAPSCWAWRCRA